MLIFRIEKIQAVMITVYMTRDKTSVSEVVLGVTFKNAHTVAL